MKKQFAICILLLLACIQSVSATVYSGSNTQTWVIPTCSLDVAVDDATHRISFIWSGGQWLSVPFPAIFTPVLSFWSVSDSKGFYEHSWYHEIMGPEGEQEFRGYYNSNTWLKTHVRWTYSVTPMIYVIVDCYVSIYIGELDYEPTGGSSWRLVRIAW